MQVQVNAKAAAASVREFVEKCGGTAKNTEALELVAKICGFASYRAMQAVSQRDESPTSTPVPPGVPLIEDPSRVVLRRPMVDWELEENPDASLSEIPGWRRGEFELVLEDFGPQFRMSIRPLGTNTETAYGSAIIDVQVEINDGVPCVHLTNDPMGEMLLTVFGTGEGLVVRQEEGERRSIADAPYAMQELAKRNGALHNAGRMFAVLNDTIWRKQVQQQANAEVAAASEAVVQSRTEPWVPRGEEEASAPLSASADALLQSCVVHVKFDESVGEMQSWLDVSIVEPNGSSELSDAVAGFTVFGKDDEDSAKRQAFVSALVPVMAYFICNEQMGYSHQLFSELIVRPNALELVSHCKAVVASAPNVQLACDAISALMAVTPTGLVLAGGSEDGVACRFCHSHYSLDDEGIALGMDCPSKKCPSHRSKSAKA